MVKNSITSFLNELSTMNYCVNRSIEKSPRDVKKTNFLSILYNKPLTRYGKLKFKVGDRVRISKEQYFYSKGMQTINNR